MTVHTTVHPKAGAVMEATIHRENEAHHDGDGTPLPVLDLELGDFRVTVFFKSEEQLHKIREGLL